MLRPQRPDLAWDDSVCRRRMVAHRGRAALTAERPGPQSPGGRNRGPILVGCLRQRPPRQRVAPRGERCQATPRGRPSGSRSRRRPLASQRSASTTWAAAATTRARQTNEHARAHTALCGRRTGVPHEAEDRRHERRPAGHRLRLGRNDRGLRLHGAGGGVHRRRSRHAGSRSARPTSVLRWAGPSATTWSACSPSMAVAERWSARHGRSAG